MSLEVLILCFKHNSLEYISNCYTVYSFFTTYYNPRFNIMQYKHNMCSRRDIIWYKHDIISCPGARHRHRCDFGCLIENCRSFSLLLNHNKIRVCELPNYVKILAKFSCICTWIILLFYLF